MIETKRKLKTFFATAFFLGILLVPAFQAQAALRPECAKDENLPEQLRNTTLSREEAEQIYNNNSCQFSELIESAAGLINYLVAFIGIFVVFMLVLRGGQMVIYSGSESGVKEAKKGMTNAVIGLALVLFSYVLINTLFSVFGVDEAFKFLNNPFK